MCIFYKKFQMFWHMDMNNDRGIVLNIELKIIEIFYWIA